MRAKGTRNKPLMVRLTEAEHEAISHKATKAGLSKADVLRFAVSKLLEDYTPSQLIAMKVAAIKAGASR